MAMLPEKRIKEMEKKYKTIKEVIGNKLPCEHAYNCGSCCYWVTEDGWGSGESPDLCMANKK